MHGTSRSSLPMLADRRSAGALPRGGYLGRVTRRERALALVLWVGLLAVLYIVSA